MPAPPPMGRTLWMPPDGGRGSLSDGGGKIHAVVRMPPPMVSDGVRGAGGCLPRGGMPAGGGVGITPRSRP
jgi:hypothetical protein